MLIFLHFPLQSIKKSLMYSVWLFLIITHVIRIILILENKHVNFVMSGKLAWLESSHQFQNLRLLRIYQLANHSGEHHVKTSIPFLHPSLLN